MLQYQFDVHSLVQVSRELLQRNKIKVIHWGPFLGKNEENEDARIASSSRGFKKSEDLGFEKSEDQGS